MESSGYHDGSPGYSDKEDCLISNFPAEPIIVEAFQTEDNGCTYDWLEVTSADGVPTKYCGTKRPAGVVATGTIKWHTDESGTNYAG